MKYNLNITDEGVFINETLINKKIFQEEKVNYSPREREDQIDYLIDWIGEAKGNDKELMKNDLKYLISLKDKFIFSSILTNEFITKSEDLERFNEICKEILEENKKL